MGSFRYDILLLAQHSLHRVLHVVKQVQALLYLLLRTQQQVRPRLALNSLLEKTTVHLDHLFVRKHFPTKQLRRNHVIRKDCCKLVVVINSLCPGQFCVSGQLMNQDCSRVFQNSVGVLKEGRVVLVEVETVLEQQEVILTIRGLSQEILACFSNEALQVHEGVHVDNGSFLPQLETGIFDEL
jgi:hypothetical protein